MSRNSDEGISKHYSELISKSFSHLKEGEQLTPPLNRNEDPLDEVILGVIGALRAETRLYPESYAWIIAEAVREALLKEPIGEEQREAALASLEAAQIASEGIPSNYPKSRLLTLLRGVWEAGWRPVEQKSPKTDAQPSSDLS